MDSPPRYERREELEDLLGRLGAADLDDNEDEERLIIGLDFGTTYSGVAYAFSNKPDAIYNVDTWPGTKGRYAKCPTLIKYDGPNSFKWGYELDRTTSGRIEGIKLMLDPSQSRPICVPSTDTEAELKKLQKPPMDVITDYITAIYRHALQVIESKCPRGYLNLLKKQFVLSVPAVWSDKAKNDTLRAARNAGISPVKAVKEPEAAALFTLHGMGQRGLNVGDALVLCDAGGGTVDLISYEIKSLQPFQLSELTTATGGHAGSMMINLRFADWIKQVIGERAFIDLKETDAYRTAMKDFDERLKPGFRSRTDEDVYLNFPKARLADNPDRGLESDTITVSGNTLYEVCDPLFREIDKLIKEQVSSVRLKRLEKGVSNGYAVKAVFLVGGFGSSDYLCEQITNAHPDIQVIQPNDAWSAIVRGAVMSQLPSEAQVVSNVAPKHYGVSAHCVYDEVRDVGQPKHWDEYDEVYRVSTMTWYIELGDDLQRSRKIDFPFVRKWPPNPADSELQIVDKLLESIMDVKPVHPREGDVRQNCVLRTDLSKVPKDLFKRKTAICKSTGHMKEWWELRYHLLVTIQSGPMLFSIQCGGKEYGQAIAEY